MTIRGKTFKCSSLCVKTYSLYAYPAVRLSYQATDFINVYALAGAEYRNYVETSAHSAQNWRWQPTAWAGFKTTF